MKKTLVLLLVFSVTLIVIRESYRRHNLFRTPTFFINLERRPDRNRHVQRILKAYFKHITRFNAVDGRKVDIQNSETLTVYYDTEENQRWDSTIRWLRSHKMSHGEVGCCLSHRRLWEKIYHKQLKEPVIIFEDDVILHPSFKNRFSAVMQQLPEEWDIIYLGCIDSGGIGDKVAPNLREVTFVFGLFGYMLSRSGIEKLYHTLPIDRPVDNFVGKLTETGSLKGFVVDPPIANQIEYGGYGSDINHSAHTL